MVDNAWIDRTRNAARGVRLRTTLVATVAVGVALLLGGVALIQATRDGQTEMIRATVETRIQDIATLIKDDALPTTLPGRGEALVAQVLSASGQVIASSPDIAGESPLGKTVSEPGATQMIETLDGGTDPNQSGHVDVERMLLGGFGVRGPDGLLTVLVAGSLTPVEDATAALVPVLAVVLPIVLLVVAGVVWLLTGRALAPVEAIRSQAEEIGAEALNLRVPVPQSGDEIERLARTMNEMLDRLDGAAQMQRRFVADASHELRSPVAAMRTMLEVAQSHPGSVDMGSLIQDLLYEDLRLETLTRDLLTLARHDEGALDVKSEQFDVCALLAEEVASARARSSHSMHLEPLAYATIMGDRDRVSQALRNLTDNALRHTVSSVWITCNVQNHDVIIMVSDDGNGIPPDSREVVFDRFVRLDDSRSRAAGGSGLGLAVCRALIEAHHGSVACVEPEHGGASFRIRLPLAAG